MNPRLVVLVGLAEGKTFSLAAGSIFTIGRDQSNHLVAPEWVVSRQHCIIKSCPDGFWLEDLNSHNGTFVNDLPVTKRQLSHGDRMRIGTSHLLFLLDEDQELPPAVEVQFDDGSLTTKSDIRLSLAKEVQPPTQELELLAKFGHALNGLQKSEELQRRLLEIILEVVPARRGAIVLFDGDLDTPKSVCALDKSNHIHLPMQLSRTVTRQVSREQVALLSNELNDRRLQAAESLIASRVCSLLCVPFSFGQTKGLLYLDSSDPDFRFTEEHLQQMTAIASLTAAAVANVRQLEEFKRENERLRSESIIETNIIGESQPMQEVFRLLAKIAPSNSTILIDGESGTGKELAARAIHHNSERRDKPFMAVNCAVLSATLLESDLFGHERGAFTGAVTQKKGKFEVADGGTVFLDEIAELAMELQAKLLRFLQEREFERVGGTKTIKIDVRVLAATNKNLKEAVERGAFRQDLFFRLNVVPVRLPPLRERSSDIPLLAKYFVHKYSERCKRQSLSLTGEALAALTVYSWPGNVRELENTIERAVVLSSSDSIRLEDLPEAVIEAWLPTKETPNSFHEKLMCAKQQIILAALQQAQGNYTNAAHALGIHPNNLHRLTRSLGIKDEAKKRG
jgi:transcriptional regulator with GAF, ATPase, and Fis domain